MTDPITSTHDTTPLPPAEGGEGEPGPDHGKDLSSLVPTDQVAWGEPPSFNDDPKDIPSDGGGAGDQGATDPSGDLKIDLSALRTTEKSILTETRAAVAKYEEVRSKVMATKDSVFGQGTKEEGKYVWNPASQGASWQEGEDNPFAEAGAQFAAEMNPAQERALLQVGSALEKLGEYIALINHSGQVYAHTDRESRFPGPPAAS
ncbi:hypothetical protein ABZW18_13905 [Streptomyces sp. NPDC004647]|uniref:hypothetical protein n=1 Tax=Streptomyces sp. NPDC004647 TaxID=3154671 RepID=UPI0033A61CD3